MKKHIDKFDLVVVPSEHTRNVLLEHTSVVPDRIRVVYNALDLSCKLDRYRTFVEGEINILMVGDSFYKDSLKAIISLSKVSLNLHSKITVKWVVSNKKAAYVRLNKVLGSASSIKVIVMEQLTNEELKLCYVNADMLLFTSISEGFGYPLIEAMALGTPVVSRNYGAMREVVGEAGLLVDDNTEESLYEVLSELERTESRYKFRALGLARANDFGLHGDFAREMKNIYESLS